MTITSAHTRQLDALAELRNTWRADKRDAYFAKPAASMEEAVGAEAGYLAYCFAARVLEADGEPTTVTAALEAEAERATTIGLTTNHSHPSLPTVYADVLHGFAEAVRAVT